MDVIEEIQSVMTARIKVQQSPLSCLFWWLQRFKSVQIPVRTPILNKVYLQL